MRNPYEVIKHRHNTEKARVLLDLQINESSKSLKKCKNPKYVFIVDKNANKQEIAYAIEKIYSHKNVRVVSVNTILKKPKKRTVRQRKGMTAFLKKAIVTLEVGDTLDEQV